MNKLLLGQGESLNELEEKLRFSDTEIIVDNNGILINYVDFLKESNLQNEENGLDADAIVVIENDTLKNTSEIPDSLNNEANYRVQIGAFKKLLPDEVFANVKNVVPFVGNDGMVRYMVGVFSDYNDAVDYQAQMIARGFHDAFIVTYKDGKRIGLNYVLNKDNSQKSNYTNSQKSNNANKKDENSKKI